MIQNVILQGLPPTETKTGYVFKPQGKLGIREIRLFSSPQQVPFFLFPASPDAYGAQLDEIDSNDLKAINMKAIRFSLRTKLLQS